MDLNVHRRITWLACQRAAKTLNSARPVECFPEIYLGNWQSDLSQASCFYDRLDMVKKGHPKNLPPKVFEILWRAEMDKVKPLGAPVRLDFGPEAFDTGDQYGIGTYCNWDHLDIVFPKGAGSTEDQEEIRLTQEDKGRRLARTVRKAVDLQAKESWFGPVFPASDAKVADRVHLRMLGRGLHLVQDFFAHTNFVDLLLAGLVYSQSQNPAQKDPALDPAFAELLRGWLAAKTNGDGDTSAPSFLSVNLDCPPASTIGFPLIGTPATTPVMSGRFEEIDTIYTLLGIYQKHLLKKDAGADKQLKNDELAFELLFAMFDAKYDGLLRTSIEGLLFLRNLMQSMGRSIREAAIDLTAGVVKLFGDDDADRVIEDLATCAKDYQGKEAGDWANAGRIAYVRTRIERSLLKELRTGAHPRLPHHTLLAKDYDMSSPEAQLVFNLTCSLATEVTEHLLVEYFRKGKGAAEILDRYLVHPSLLSGISNAAMRSATDTLYGERWWAYSDPKRSNRILPIIQ